eukprot:superscaffoldBa00000656_g6348
MLLLRRGDETLAGKTQGRYRDEPGLNGAEISPMERGSGAGTEDRAAAKVETEKLDYYHYMPLFFDGSCKMVHLYEFYARQRVHDLPEHGGPKILPVIPQLIVPIRNALNTRNCQVMTTILKVLQHLLMSGDKVREALVPY